MTPIISVRWPLVLEQSFHPLDGRAGNAPVVPVRTEAAQVKLAFVAAVPPAGGLRLFLADPPAARRARENDRSGHGLRVRTAGRLTVSPDRG